jgi:hypothetical protein
MKPIDAIAVGMYTHGHPEQIRENAVTVANLMACQERRKKR